MKRVIISVVLLFVIAGLFLVSINGVRPHPYTEAELETVFLEKAEWKWPFFGRRLEVVEKKHANSMTLSDGRCQRQSCVGNLCNDTTDRKV